MTPHEAADMMGEQELAPGVHGWYFDKPDGIYIPVITADNPGNGDVARYLDSLPKDRRIVFCTVLSSKLRTMLLKRGFMDAEEFSPEFNEMVQVMLRKPVTHA